MSMESRSTKSRRRKPPDVFPHLLTRALRLIDTEKSQYVRQESPAELVDKYADASRTQLELERNRSTLESKKRRAQTPCPPLIGAPGVIAATQRYCEDRRRPNRTPYPNTSESDLHTAQNLAAWIQVRIPGQTRH